MRTDDLCPCGAVARPGSAYCSDDCVPTHRGADTISDIDGTGMRWRPDLDDESDDLEAGERWAGGWHCRLPRPPGT